MKSAINHSYSAIRLSLCDFKETTGFYIYIYKAKCFKCWDYLKRAKLNRNSTHSSVFLRHDIEESCKS